MQTYTSPRTADLSRISATKLKTLWPIGSEGRWNPDSESPELSHRNTLPRLRGGWCKSVIDSVHHCITNLPQIQKHVNSNPVKIFNASYKSEKPSHLPLNKWSKNWRRRRESNPRINALKEHPPNQPSVRRRNWRLRRDSNSHRTPRQGGVLSLDDVAVLYTIRMLDFSQYEGCEIERAIAPDETNKQLAWCMREDLNLHRPEG